MTAHAVSLVLADDDAAMRAALVELVETEPSLDLLGVGTDGAEALALAERLSPDILLLDLRMPGGGDGLVRKVAALARPPRVIVLTAQNDQAVMRRMTEAGVSRFLVKGVPGSAILDALLDR